MGWKDVLVIVSEAEADEPAIALGEVLDDARIGRILTLREGKLVAPSDEASLGAVAAPVATS